MKQNHQDKNNFSKLVTLVKRKHTVKNFITSNFYIKLINFHPFLKLVFVLLKLNFLKIQCNPNSFIVRILILRVNTFSRFWPVNILVFCLTESGEVTL